MAALSGNVERGAVRDAVPGGGHDALVELEQLLQHPHAPLLGGDVGGGVPVLKYQSSTKVNITNKE